MNNNKHLKPNLINPVIEKKIMKTLQPPQYDYWAPTKNTCRNFYRDYLRSNVALIFVMLIVILFLIYRYRVTKNKKQLLPLKELPDQSNHFIDQYTNLLINAYEQEHELQREPKYHNKINHHSAKTYYKNRSIAYPIYPYQGGMLLSPQKSK